MLVTSLRAMRFTQISSPLKRWFSVASHLDPLQEAAMKERCIVVDENDNAVGSASKRECHLIGSDGNLLLHRAFSVFIFNSKGDLLLQKRSAQKITFPNCFTNACCSHPLYDVEGESEEYKAMGVRRAARRRLEYELGIPREEIALDDFNYLTRMHYKAENDGIWGEHEIDYIFIFQGNVTLKPNKNEVSELIYIPRNQFDLFLQTAKSPLTPWFRLISHHKLLLWWDNLNNLKQFEDHQTIYRF